MQMFCIKKKKKGRHWSIFEKLKLGQEKIVSVHFFVDGVYGQAGSVARFGRTPRRAGSKQGCTSGYS
jgi:hypothetical protein